MTTVAIIDYGMGNLRSVAKAIEHVAPGHEVFVTSDPARVAAAERVVFPGQGAMPDCMRELDARGLRPAVLAAAAEKPFLGICIGQQMLFQHSAEGDVADGAAGLGDVVVHLFRSGAHWLTLAMSAPAAAMQASYWLWPLPVVGAAEPPDGAVPPPVAPVTPIAPIAPVQQKEKKPKGLFKAPSFPSSVLRPRVNLHGATPSTIADPSTFPPPIEGDLPLPSSNAADSKGARVVLSAKRTKELEREAKEKEYADGQHANMIDGVWHCSNCGCPENIAIGRRKGPLGDKSQCGTCGM